jgi:hypothetical protein
VTYDLSPHTLLLLLVTWTCALRPDRFPLVVGGGRRHGSMGALTPQIVIWLSYSLVTYPRWENFSLTRHRPPARDPGLKEKED